jgi:MoaA/NifB/PqqE/SkfB family radical SAM enzyme
MMLQKIRRVFQKAASRPYKLIQIEPSLECTLDCVMCPWSELRPENATMTWDTFMHIVPYLHLTDNVDYTGGGEPLKNPRLVEMVKVAKQAGCAVGFSTNGTRLEEGISEQLIRLELDWISFSVDAATKELYERIRRGARFQTVIDNISTLRDLKQLGKSKLPRMMMVYVMMTGEQENYQELPAFIELSHRLGVEQVVAKNLDVILKDGDDERRLFSHNGQTASAVEASMAEARLCAQKLGVGLRFYAMHPQEVTICEHNPLQSVFINWEGFVSPCITLSYAENRIFDGMRILTPCQRFGDICSETLPDIWEKHPYRQFRSFYEARLRLERQATIDHMLGGPAETNLPLPPAPEGCLSCYYLYGV